MNNMSELEEFFSKTAEEYKKELQDFKEFQRMLESFKNKKNISYVRHDITANT